VLPRWPILLLAATACGASEMPTAPDAATTDAVLTHDGEAAASRSAFQALSSDDQRSLIDFVSAL
jgi:CxxC motif-containing protein (DUF1111 family)